MDWHRVFEVLARHGLLHERDRAAFLEHAAQWSLDARNGHALWSLDRGCKLRVKAGGASVGLRVSGPAPVYGRTNDERVAMEASHELDALAHGTLSPL